MIVKVTSRPKKLSLKAALSDLLVSYPQEISSVNFLYHDLVYIVQGRHCISFRISDHTYSLLDFTASEFKNYVRYKLGYHNDR